VTSPFNIVKERAPGDGGTIRRRTEPFGEGACHARVTHGFAADKVSPVNKPSERPARHHGVGHHHDRRRVKQYHQVLLRHGFDGPPRDLHEENHGDP
jgi:hypothetical protein